jgi:hypothetical protein
MLFQSLFLFSSTLAQSMLEFNPPSFEFADTKKNNSFKVKLLAKPSKDVTVFFEAPGMKFRKCSYVILADKWNEYIDVPVRTVPVFTDRESANVNITAKVQAEGVDYNQTEQTYLGKRSYTKGGVCTSKGNIESNIRGPPHQNI